MAEFEAGSAVFKIVFVAGLVILLILVLVLVWRLLFLRRKRSALAFSLSRVRCNPILSPEDGEHWEQTGTFNPAVFNDQDQTHILYRAIGADGVSRIGYAESINGISVSYRYPTPIFSLMSPNSRVAPEDQRFSPGLYASGGSWGGCEDPRVVVIDGRIYMTFNAFDGWDYLRVAVTSISEEDFANKRWNWNRPVFMSPENQIHKNWVLFPEKINDKFAILHSITPSIMIDYVDRLEDLADGTAKIQSRTGSPQGGRKDFWDNRVRGAGPPPLKTSKGWLVLYHAITESESHKYKLGAFLLDLNDPTKIIARSPSPLLVPDEWYENNWKPGIVYACGATIKNDVLSVYYGGGDKYLCVAQAPLKELLHWLTTYGKVK